MDIAQQNKQYKKIVTFLSLGIFILTAYFLLGASGLVDNETYHNMGLFSLGFALLFGGYGFYLMFKKN